MFEWDEDKRLKNLAKHKLDFMDARALFDGRASLTAPSSYDLEPRQLTIGVLDGAYYSVIWTWRDGNRRLISFRRARDGEKRAYRQIYG